LGKRLEDEIMERREGSEEMRGADMRAKTETGKGGEEREREEKKRENLGCLISGHGKLSTRFQCVQLVETKT
jgi:hypothetical protein